MRLRTRKTLIEHLYSFKKYSSINLNYLNVKNKIPFGLTKKNMISFYHYSFLGNERFLEDEEKMEDETKEIKNFRAIKVAIPQDECQYSQRLFNLFKDANVDLICNFLLEILT